MYQRKSLCLASWACGFLLALSFWMAPQVGAYPPAPFHLLYGTLRDPFGTPLAGVDAEVILETSTGVQVRTSLNPGIEAGANYRLEVPMDAGLLAAAYQPTALRPFVPFRVKVRVGKLTYLPIEMRGEYASLGQPGKRTRLDLTLGEDSNGDGLPDAWQRLINADLSQVRPDADAGNGLTYLQTYLAGTYVVDPKAGFQLNILGVAGGQASLEFLAATGRTYVIQGSSDMETWSQIRFRLPTDPVGEAARGSLVSDSVKQVHVEIPSSESEPLPKFFRLVLQ